MGSLGYSDPSEESEITVLVTGFAPFRPQYPLNPSWEIAASLPEYLPQDKAKDWRRNGSGRMPPRVRLLVHPEPIRVSYEVTRNLIPSLWEGQAKRIDYAIHIGMAGPGQTYQVERLAHRDGYKLKDVDGNLLDDEERQKREGEDWIWHGLPSEIQTDLNIEDIFKRWSSKKLDGLPAQLEISNDPGRYLCDFIYYSSLAYLTKKEERRRVLFFHIPCESDNQKLATGHQLLIDLIRSVVESENGAEQPIAI